MSSIRSFTLLALPALVLAGGDVAGNGFIRHGVKPIAAPLNSNISRRQNEVDLKEQRIGTLYTIDLEIGTPEQPVTVIIDTGSSELWVNPDCDNAGSQGNIDFCKSLPVFDSDSSSSLTDLGETGHVSYSKGGVDFEYYTDFVSVGSAKISEQRFGVATASSDVYFGVMGLAPRLTDDDVDYPFILDSLASQGFINSRAFTLDLRSIDSPDDLGSVIFGGIDTGKYTGELEKVPIVDLSATSGDRYWINMNFAGLTMPNGSTTQIYKDTTGFAVFLDSGGTLSRLPSDIYNGVGAAFPGAKIDFSSGFYVVDCDVAETSGSVDFGFGGKVIRVAFKDFIWHIPESTECVVGILPEDLQPVLGDSFLRAAYVVYDQDNRNLHLAQASDCGETLVAIGSGPDAVPSVAGDCPFPSTIPPQTSSSTSTLHPTTTSHSYPNGTYPNGTMTTARPTYTSTYTTTSVYTITACPPTVTNCPVGHVTTDVITATTTWCPGTTISSPKSTYTSTYITKTTYTITSCPPQLPNCPVGQLTTENVVATSVYHPGAMTVAATTTGSIDYWGPCVNCGPRPTTLATNGSTTSPATPTSSYVATGGASRSKAGARLLAVGVLGAVAAWVW